MSYTSDSDSDDDAAPSEFLQFRDNNSPFVQLGSPVPKKNSSKKTFNARSPMPGRFQHRKSVDKLDARQGAQKRTFTRWCNHFLSERMLKVDDLFTDFHDGILLIQLIEIISARRLGKYNKRPRMKVHRVENLNKVLVFLKKEGLKLVNIDSGDIHDGNPKLILGLIWTLILRYAIHNGGEAGSPKRLLLDWVNKQIKPYGMKAQDFTRNFQDGKILCALTDSLEKGSIDVGNKGSHLSGNPIKDTTLAIKTAYDKLDIPELVDANDVVNHPDDLSMMTYVAFFRDYADNKKKMAGEYSKFGPNAGESYATGKGVEGGFANRPLPFTIHSNKEDGTPANNPKYVGEWDVKINGPKGPVDCKIQDNGDGTLSGEYYPDSVGDYNVAIAVKQPNGKGPVEQIKGSVYQLKVREGGDPSKSWAEGPGLTEAFDDQPAYFTVHVLDTNGLPVAGEDGLTVDISPADDQPHHHQQQQNHHHQSSEPVMQRPKFCEDCGQKFGPNSKKFCEDCGCKIIAKPISMTSAPANIPTSNIPLNSVPANVKDNGDGTYDVEYEAKVPGKYLINVAIVGDTIKDMPSYLTVRPGADPNKTYATGRGVTSPGFAGLPHPFTIHCVDPAGNPVQVGGQNFVPTIIDPNGKSILCELKDNGDGTYSGEYIPDQIGNYVVDLKMDKNGKLKGIKDNPFRIEVNEPADPSKSYAEGEGIKFAVDNRPAKFKVFAKDKNGRPVVGLTAGEWLGVKLTDPETDPNGEGDSLFPTKIHDNGDGSYDVEYNADTPGDYKLDVTIAEKSIKDMPRNLQVLPGVDAANTEVTGPGVESGLPGRSLPFTIQAKDKHGNNVPVGGDDFKATVKDPNGQIVPCDIKDNGDGTYSGTYEPMVPGDFTVEFKVNDDQNKVGNSPYTCHVGEGADANKCYCKGTGWKYAYDNEPTEFNVYCFDVNGDPVVGEIVNVTMVQMDDQKEKGLLQGLIDKVDEYMLQKKEEENQKWADERAAQRKAKGLPPIEQTSGDVICDVTDNKDGTYKIEYCAQIPGTYKCNVQVGYTQSHVKKSPKEIPVRWRCPNSPCVHTKEEMHAEMDKIEQDNELLKQKIRELGGDDIIQQLIKQGKIN